MGCCLLPRHCSKWLSVRTKHGILPIATFACALPWNTLKTNSNMPEPVTKDHANLRGNGYQHDSISYGSRRSVLPDQKCFLQPKASLQDIDIFLFQPCQCLLFCRLFRERVCNDPVLGCVLLGTKAQQIPFCSFFVRPWFRSKVEWHSFNWFYRLPNA